MGGYRVPYPRYPSASPAHAGTHPLLHVGTLRDHWHLVPVDILLPVLPDLAPCLVSEEADEAEQDDDEEPADDGHGLNGCRECEGCEDPIPGSE